MSQAPMRVGDQFLACSVTIMEGDDMQFLFGLDMLRRHQCQVSTSAQHAVAYGTCCRVRCMMMHKAAVEHLACFAVLSN